MLKSQSRRANHAKSKHPPIRHPQKQPRNRVQALRFSQKTQFCANDVLLTQPEVVWLILHFDPGLPSAPQSRCPLPLTFRCYLHNRHRPSLPAGSGHLTNAKTAITPAMNIALAPPYHRTDRYFVLVREITTMQKKDRRRCPAPVSTFRELLSLYFFSHLHNKRLVLRTEATCALEKYDNCSRSHLLVVALLARMGRAIRTTRQREQKTGVRVAGSSTSSRAVGLSV